MTVVTRRSLLQLTSAALAGLLVSFKKAVATFAPPAPPLTISQILRVSYLDALNSLRVGNPWVSNELNVLHAAGYLRLQSLGAFIEEPVYTAGAYEPRFHPVQELSVPMVWGPQEDTCTPAKKARLASSLIENAVRVHDQFLLERIRDHKAVYASREYRYDLGETHPIRNTDGTVSCYVAKIYTAFCPIPAHV